MRPPGALHLGQPVIVMGTLCVARRCVWPARSTPLNWELSDFPVSSPYLCVRQRPKKETRLARPGRVCQSF